MVRLLRYLLQMVPAAVLGAGVWRLTRRLRRRGSPGREWVWFFLITFVSGLLWLTLTPPGVEEFLRSGRWPYPLQGGINLIPLQASLRMFRYYIKHEMWTSLLVNFLGNVVMFVPIGFFSGLLLDRPRWWKSALWTFALSFFIEFFQLFAARETDVDDLILNTLGGLLGYGFFSLARRFLPNLVGMCK